MLFLTPRPCRHTLWEDIGTERGFRILGVSPRLTLVGAEEGDSWAYWQHVGITSRQMAVAWGEGCRGEKRQETMASHAVVQEAAFVEAPRCVRLSTIDLLNPS